jgi:hypothetical protein
MDARQTYPSSALATSWLTVDASAPALRCPLPDTQRIAIQPSRGRWEMKQGHPGYSHRHCAVCARLVGCLYGLNTCIRVRVAHLWPQRWLPRRMAWHIAARANAAACPQLAEGEMKYGRRPRGLTLALYIWACMNPSATNGAAGLTACRTGPQAHRTQP